MKIIRAIWPLLLFAGLGLAFAISLTRDPAAIPTQGLDQPLRPFQIEGLYDKNRIYTEADFVGQVTLLNVFGSWCAACVQEHPGLVAIARTGEVRLVGVNWRDTREAAKRWLARYGDPYANILFDEASLLAIDLGVTGAPESFLIDKAGHVRYKHTGIITPDIWRSELRPLIRQLKAE